MDLGSGLLPKQYAHGLDLPKEQKTSPSQSLLFHLLFSRKLKKKKKMASSSRNEDEQINRVQAVSIKVEPKTHTQRVRREKVTDFVQATIFHFNYLSSIIVSIFFLFILFPSFLSSNLGLNSLILIGLHCFIR